MSYYEFCISIQSSWVSILVAVVLIFSVSLLTLKHWAYSYLFVVPTLLLMFYMVGYIEVSLVDEKGTVPYIMVVPLPYVFFVMAYGGVVTLARLDKGKKKDDEVRNT